MALGSMVANGRFSRPTCVFIDGDSEPGAGCHVLPGGDAPEQVVFKGLRAKGWQDLWVAVARDTGLVHDACTNAMTLDHHEWVKFAANHMRYSADALWRAMCAETGSTGWSRLRPAGRSRMRFPASMIYGGF